MQAVQAHLAVAIRLLSGQRPVSVSVWGKSLSICYAHHTHNNNSNKNKSLASVGSRWGCVSDAAST